MKKILLWSGLGLLLLFLTIGLIRSQKGQVSVGEIAPDFELTSFDGDFYQLSDFRGYVVVLNFWASWCESCKPEAEDLEAAYQYYKSRGDVIFLGVDYVKRFGLHLILQPTEAPLRGSKCQPEDGVFAKKQCSLVLLQ